MNKLIIIPFTLVLSICFGQKSEVTLENLKKYPKGNSTVIITSGDSITLAFKRVASIVMDYGFTIANSDKELYYINTDFVALGDYAFETKLNIRLRKTTNGGTEIIIKAESKNMGYNFTAENRHRKDVPNRAFAQMLEVAGLYEGGEISTGSDK